MTTETTPKTDNTSTGNTSTDNTSIVQRAMGELIATGDVNALGRVLSDDFVHHRPDATSTKHEWLAAVHAALAPLAGMRIEVDHVLADGDHVVMHSRRRLPDAGPEIVVVDIWRFDDGLITEAWEIIEPVAQASANLVWWEPAET